MVGAAHRVPFAETHDDDPRNGIALAPTFHWALDACRQRRRGISAFHGWRDFRDPVENLQRPPLRGGASSGDGNGVDVAVHRSAPKPAARP